MRTSATAMVMLRRIGRSYGSALAGRRPAQALHDRAGVARSSYGGAIPRR